MLRELLEVGKAFCNGFADGYTGASEFGPRYRAIRDAFGLQVVGEERTSAMVKVGWDGWDFNASLFPMRDGYVHHLVYSAVGFPAHRFPPSVAQLVANLDRKMTRCRMEIGHSSRHSCVLVGCKIPMGIFTPATFRAAMEDMLPRLVILDRFLVEECDCVRTW